MDKKRDAFGKASEETEDFIIRVGQRAQFKLRISQHEFTAKEEERRQAFDLAEAERIAREEQADSRGKAIWTDPPRKRGSGRPKPPYKAQTQTPGRGPGHSEHVGKTNVEETDTNNRFATFEGTY
jgi:hypothetical protein